MSDDAHGSSREAAGEPVAAGAFSSNSIAVAEVALMPVCAHALLGAHALPGLHAPDSPLLLAAALCPEKLLPSFLAFAFLCKNGCVSLTGFSWEEMRRGRSSSFPRLCQQAFDGDRGMSWHACPASSLLFSLECSRVISSQVTMIVDRILLRIQHPYDSLGV